MTGPSPAPSHSDYDSAEDVKPQKKRARTSKAGGSPRKKPEAWTPEEDAVVIQAMIEILKPTIWAKVRTDPKVSRRGSTGVQVRMGVLLKAIKSGK